MKKRKGIGGVLVARLNQLNRKLFDRNVNRHEIDGIDSDLASIIFVLMQKDDIGIKDVVTATGFPKSTLTSMLDRLEKHDWILRSPSQVDRRAINIKLKKTREEVMAVFGVVIQDQQDVFYQGFSESEIADLDRLLAKACENLSAEVDRPLKDTKEAV